MLKIRDLLRYERLTGGSLFDGVPQIETLIYCSTPDAYTKHTLQEWTLSTLGASAFMTQAANRLADEYALLQQYSTLTAQKDTAEPIAPGTCTNTLTSVVAEIITEGIVPVDYLLDRAELWELPIYIEAIERRRHARLERERLWAYIGLLPHIDSKNIKRPQDLIPFDWERSTIDHVDEDTSEWNEARLRAFSKTDTTPAT